MKKNGISELADGIFSVGIGALLLWGAEKWQNIIGWVLLTIGVIILILLMIFGALTYEG